MDTLGTDKGVVIQRFPLIRGYFVRIAIYLDPHKQSVMEKFSLLGTFVVRSSAIFYLTEIPIEVGHTCIHKAILNF